MTPREILRCIAIASAPIVLGGVVAVATAGVGLLIGVLVGVPLRGTPELLQATVTLGALAASGGVVVAIIGFIEGWWQERAP